MANRHWPSMFKSKPCASHRQWQHDINSSLLSSACQKTPYSSAMANEERSPEPKPRWNPKPEQIRILEAIFNSGMVNPPRDEIRKIRAQLQEYGQVGDANVFYWFQNRKSRNKNKQRNFQTAATKMQAHTSPPIVAAAAPSSSSSSSEKSETPRHQKALAVDGRSVINVSNSPTASVNQAYFQTDYSPEPFFFQVQQVGGAPLLSEPSNVIQMPEHEMGPCTGLLHELMSREGVKKLKMEPHHSYVTTATAITTTAAAAAVTAVTTTNLINGIEGIGNSGGSTAAAAPSAVARSTVFINDVAFEVGVGPLNVHMAFGDDAVLLNSYGQPVLTNEWGVTLHALQHGAFYYLV